MVVMKLTFGVGGSVGFVSLRCNQYTAWGPIPATTPVPLAKLSILTVLGALGCLYYGDNQHQREQGRSTEQLSPPNQLTNNKK